MGIVINHEIRIPTKNTLDSMESQMFFFQGSIEAAQALEKELLSKCKKRVLMTFEITLEK